MMADTPLRNLVAIAQDFPIAGTFTISRGAKTRAEIVTITITDGHHRGRGEGVPYARYDETRPSVLAQIETCRGDIEAGCDRAHLSNILAPGAARNALDCALWDLEAKQTSTPVWQMAGLEQPQPTATAYTISLDAPEAMATAALAAAGMPLLKLKLGGAGDEQRILAIRAALPDARLIIDANEAWDETALPGLLTLCQAANIELIEQPLAAGHDQVLAHIDRIVPICADETIHGTQDLADISDRYDAINVKLDKTGGLSHALTLVKAAKALNLKIMIGCMVASSLSIAPALLLAQQADFVDLDGALLLAQDREPGLTCQAGRLHPARPELWG